MENMTAGKEQNRFLASEIPNLPREQCRFHVIPVPLEQSVSYGGGTAKGPAAILAASYQLEAFDGHRLPCEEGIWTAEAVDCLGDIEGVLARVGAAVSDVMDLGAVPFVLGGEHTVTLGAVRAFTERGRRIGVVQFDAHADLRDVYEGDPLSHACVMRRVLELGVPLCQLGVRAMSAGEVAVRAEHDVTHVDAEDLAAGEPLVLPDGFPEEVYVSFDIDALDSSIMPATGTPEPGGLAWWQAMRLLRQIAAQRRIVGMDVVELAPIPGWHAADFTAARLVYNMMGIV
jgi:agmatinase